MSKIFHIFHVRILWFSLLWDIVDYDWVVKQENPAYSYIRYFSAWNLTVNSLFFFKRFKTTVMLLSLEIFFTLFI